MCACISAQAIAARRNREYPQPDLWGAWKVGSTQVLEDGGFLFVVDGGRRIVEESAEGDWGACDLKGGLAVVSAQEIVDWIQVCVIVSAIRDRSPTQRRHKNRRL